MQIINCAQNSEEWLRARMGIATASQFSAILAKGEGKTRRTYMLKLAGEIITGEPMEGFSNEHTDRGHEMEDEARDLYAFQTGAPLERVGFIRNGRAGCSPDSLIGIDGGLEIKTKLPHLLIELMLKNEFPPEHKAQVQGALWVAKRQWWDLSVYYRGMPPFVIRTHRDERYIQTLATEVDRFNAELDGVVTEIRRRGEQRSGAAPSTHPAPGGGARATAAPPYPDNGGAAEPAKTVRQHVEKLTGLLADRHRDNLIRQIASLDTSNDIAYWRKEGEAQVERLPDAMADHVRAELAARQNTIKGMGR